MSWQPINWHALPERPAVTPTLGGLIYPGLRHVLSGPPEAAKTWVAYALALEEIRNGGVVLCLDFEMSSYQTRDRLRLMGATDDEIERFLYVAPESMATDDEIGDLIHHEQITMTIIDAVAGAYNLQGLDDNSRKDAQHFYATTVDPFWRRGVSTLLIDHVVKNPDNRGAFTIGSERKIGAADVHLGFDSVVPFGVGRIGRIKVSTKKDRFGCLPRPQAGEIELRSDKATGAVTWTIAKPDGSEDWRPTALMEKVSRYLEEQTDPVSRHNIEKNVQGKGVYVRQAVDELIAAGFATETPGANRAQLLSSTGAYRTPAGPSGSSRPGTNPTYNTSDEEHQSVPPFSAQPSANGSSSRFVPGSSGRTQSGSSLVPSSKGGTRTDEQHEDNLSRYGQMTYAQLQAEFAQP